MATHSILVLALLALALAAAPSHAEHQIPASWGTCKRSDVKFDECLKGAMQRAMRELEKGNAEFGLSSLDPVHLQQLRLDKNGGGALTIDMTFSDVDLSGLKDATVQSVKSDLSKYEITAVMTTPRLDLNSKYKVVGRVLLIPINGHGRAIIKMEKPLMKLTMQGQKKKGESGRDHIHFDHANFEIVPEKTTFQFINPAHATQAGLLSRVVSENDKVIMQDLQPAVSQAFSSTLIEIANKIFDKVAFEDAFPQ